MLGAFIALGAAVACGGDATPPVSAQPKTPLTQVIVSPTQHTLVVGEVFSYVASPRDAAGFAYADRTVTWSSSAPSIASVNPGTGRVTAVSPGVATISATAEGRTGTASVQVTGPATAVSIDSPASTIFVGRSVQMTTVALDAANQVVTGRIAQWTTSAPSVALVTDQGIVVGVAPGAAVITVRVDGALATHSVVVLPIPAAIISLLPSNGFLARGVSFPLGITDTDVDGNALTPKVVTYSTSAPAIATVSAAGVVTPVTNGAVVITVVADGIAATSQLQVMDPRVVAGQVITSDDGAPSNLFIAARIAATGQRFTAPIDAATGVYSLVLPNFGNTGPSLEFFTDAVAGTIRRYHPSYRVYAPGDAPSGAKLLLVAHSVVPDSGTYAGRTLPVDLNAAFTPVCTTAGDANCQSYWPAYWVGGIKMWPDRARPVPLAIDRTTMAAVAGTDSIGLWATIRNMEADLGRSLFAPANFKPYTSTGYTAGMVLVSIDPTVAPFSGYTNWGWDANGEVTQARVRFAASRYFSSGGITSHELNHSLGLHHTCVWATIMGSYGCPIEPRMSASDVAYFHLALHVRDKVNALDPTWSIMEALQGVRVIELGIPSSNATPLSMRSMLTRVGTSGSDSAP
ncbi:MAG: Ig-like domain-containing protein [bacterium]